MSVAEPQEPRTPDEVLDIVSHMSEADRDRVLRGLLAQRVAHHGHTLPCEEFALLRVINEGLPLEADIRYKELQAKLWDETLTEDEQAELIDLTDMAENHNVGRVAAMIELARLRGVSFDELREQLDMNRQDEA
jgi:hypothetical protein